jgi:hypothetical protein
VIKKHATSTGTGNVDSHADAHVLNGTLPMMHAEAEGFTSRGHGIFLLGKLSHILPQQLQWSFIYEKTTTIANSASNPRYN